MRLVSWGFAIVLVAQPASALPPDVQPPGFQPALRIQQGVQADPAEELYREGINDLNGGSPGVAAGKFQTLVTRYPRSKYVPEALYWRAFALARKGERDNSLEDFRQGLAAIREMRKRFRKAFSRGDGPALEQRIVGQLAQRGDVDAANAVREQGRSVGQSAEAGANCDGDITGSQSADVQIAALNALARMDPAEAFPTLQKILRQRDKSSVCLRRAAILLVAQQRTDGVEGVLLNATRNDPDLEVRKQAVLYLSQFTTEQAMSALDSIIRETRDTALVSTAVFALSRSSDPRARDAMAAYAERDDLPEEVQRQVIFEILRRDGGMSAASLQRIYRRLAPKDIDLRREILQRMWGTSPFGDSAAGRWYLGIARDNSEAVDLRIDALNKAAHMVPIQNRMKIYTPTLDREQRRLLIDAYASNEHLRQDHSAVLDDLGEIARRDPDSELRLKALSLISSSNNPHAADVLQDIITRP